MKMVFFGSRLPHFRPVLLAGLLAVITCGGLLSARGQVIISEFMAANHSRLVDEDGATSDWIEIYNGGTSAVDLGGWHLTDSASDLTMWTFPSTNLGANCFLLVWASGKDRTVAGAPLHTSFSLSSSGEYLALVKPDGTVASEFSPTFPPQYMDISYGVIQQVTTNTLLAGTALARVLVPTNGSLGTNWILPAFNDSGWRAATNGVGYQNYVPGFAAKLYKASGTVSSTTDAEAVISTPSLQSAVYTETRNVINYMNTVTSANYGNDYTFPGLTIGVDVDDFVLEATGFVTIPAAGNWTFGVNSDDGFSLTVGAFFMSVPGARGPADTLQTFSFPAAGEYPIRLVYFERGGGSEVEMYAAQGSFTAWNALNFSLVGDTASGGLAVRSLPMGATSFSACINTDVKASMTNQNATAYVRLPFVATNPATMQTLTLIMIYDDGFVAYLNGTEVARRNAPTTPVWNSTATVSRTGTNIVVDEAFDLTPMLGQLVTGTNLLAIQGMNDSASGDDFLIAAQITEFRAVGLTNQFLATPTPGSFNVSQLYYSKVADTKWSHDRGFYETNFFLTITCGTTGAVIRCTTDGSLPSLSNGFTYTNAIPVTNTTTMKVRAFLTGYTPSDPDAQTFIFIRDVLQQREGVAPGPAWPTNGTGPNNQIIDYGLDMAVVTNAAWSGEISNDLRSIPTFSLVMDVNDLFNQSTGIYVNPGQDGSAWERPASLELIYPDGTKGFQANCGVRMRGGYSRDPSNPKHAFRILFSTDYGPGKLSFPVCGTTNGAAQTFQKFDLRTFENYSWSFGGDTKFTGMRDTCNRDTQLAMGDAGSHGGYFYLYINGQFWGIYNIDERPEANFGESYFGGSAEQYDTVKITSDTYTVYATDGSLDAWFRLWQQATNGFADLVAYEKVQGNNPDGTRNPNYENLLDVDDLMDYMLVHLWGNDLDAPISNFLANESPNNIYCLRNTNNTAGFRFITHDAEHTYLLYNVAIDRFGPFPAGDPFATNANGSYNGFPKSSPGYLWKAMTASPEFRMRVADRVQKFCFNGGVLTVPSVLSRFMARSNEIYSAIPLESARWGNSKRIPSYTRTDWLAAVNDSASFVQQRTALLLSQLTAKGFFPTVLAPSLSQYSGSVVPGYSLAVTNPNGTGQIYYTLDGSDPRLLGGALASTALAYNTNLTLSTHTFLRARVKNGVDWSPIIEANLYVTQDFSKLIVSEIMYNPAGGDSYEFLELKNVGDRTLDLSGLYFSSGITFTFTNGTLLAPGHFLVLARNAANFASRYPGITVNGLYTGKLSNSGDTLKVDHPLGGTVLSLTYNDSAPWPAAPDGFGFSLVPVNPIAPFDANNAANWRASAALYGSPGADDPVPAIAPILVNEILSSSTFPQVDAVELFNPTAADVDVGGWFITDDKNTPMKYRIPVPTIIRAGGYVVFDESQFNPVPGVEPSFSFSSQGEQVYLFSGTNGSVATLTGYSHGFSFGAATPGVSFGRYVNSVGVEQFPAQAALTLGAINAGPLIGPVVINEIMYHPLTGGNSFVELKNITASAVPLYDPANPTNTWRINGMGFSFPTGAQIAANGYVIVADTAPAVFRSLYNVPLAVPIFGPYPGSLQNSGETLELQMPGVPDTNGVPMITVDAVRYDDVAPWPVSADGDGPSLQRHLATAYGNDPTNWFASGTTPGGDNLYNAAPTITLTTPTNGASFNVPVNILLQATASDSDGTISKVEFFQNSVKIGESTTSPFSFTWVNVPAGSYTLTARAIDNGFATAMSSNVQITVIPPPLGTGIGLKGDYYDNMDYTGYLFSTTNGTINFDWSTGSPTNTMGVDTFTIRWTGMVQPRFSDTYTFYTTSDDGARLWVNGQLLIDKWVNQSATEWSGSIALLAGQYYNIQMDYYENTGYASAKLAWSSANVAKEIIPQPQLYPFYLPVIITQPAARTVGQGTTATFTVMATNTPTGYQWLFNSAPIAGATNSTLTLTNAQLTQAGSYSVIVGNAAGSVLSLTATLTVIPPPVITSQPQSLSLMTGSNATFSVGASGTPPLAFQWRLNGTNLAGATNFFLILTNVQSFHVGLYSVTVSNLGGVAVSDNADLAVSGPPVLVGQPSSHPAGLGSNTTFTVLVANQPTGWQWYFNNTTLLDGATSATLLLTNVQYSQVGSYTVVVTNSYDSVTSAPAMLDVGAGPAITTQPHGLTVTGYTTVTFTVAASGAAPLQYQWLFNGTSRPGATNTSLVLTNLQASQSGQYRVVVTSPYGTAYSDPAQLTVIMPLIITNQPQGQSAWPYTNITLALGVSGSLPISYQWRLANTNLPGATNATLVNTNVLPSAAGNYTVVATNSVSAVTSLVATLTVFTNPLIFTQPLGHSAMVGSNATFSVVATSSSPLRYQWFFNTNTTLAGATNDSLTFTNVQTSNYGFYNVRVFDTFGSTWSDSAQMADKLKPSITQQPFPTNSVILLGTPFALSSSAIGPAPLSFRWRRSGTTVTNMIQNETNSTYYIPAGPFTNLLAPYSNVNVGFTYAGIYDVVVTNVAGNAPASSRASLAIMEPLTNHTAQLGSNVTFTFMACSVWTNTVSAASALRYQWFFNSTNLLLSRTNLANMTLTLTNITLNLTNVQYSDEGPYTAVVTTSNGVYATQTAILTILRRPTISAQPTNQSLSVGDTAVFTVGATGVPSPGYQWWFNQTNLLAGATGPTLTLTNAQTLQAGGYSVVVSNSVGAVTSQIAQLTVTFSEPPQLGNVAGPPAPGGLLQFTFGGVAGQSYTVLWREFLDLGNWQPLTNISLLGSSQPVLIQDTTAGQTQRFYRVVMPMQQP